MACDRRDVEEMVGLLPLHVGQCRGNAVQHAFDVHVDHSIPLVDFEPLKWSLRHQAGIIDHHVDATEVLDQKGPEGDVSAQRPEIGYHHTREMAAKTAFLLASCQLRVSEDWVVADAVERNRSLMQEQGIF
jgi:hypothetical protein